MFELKKRAPSIYELPKTGNMHVPGLLIASEPLLEKIYEDRSLEQVANVAELPGIVGYSMAMPDIHWGYGFPIGGVAATDFDTGVISPGGVGYDINCGVRLAVVPIPFTSLSEATKSQLLQKNFELIPSGTGKDHKNERGLSDHDYGELVVQGAKWSVDRGYGFPEDLEHSESNGCIEGGKIEGISRDALDRARKQLGTIGSGNHFVEIGAVETVIDVEVAKKWGISANETYVLIHSGSRGFGHQICTDTLDEFLKKGFDKGLPDAQLVAAPIQSPEGRQYYQSMAAAANFAFNNRQQILSLVREAFHEVCKVVPRSIRLIYDVCHNIAKIETPLVDGVLKKLCVHRKGATRAFGKGAKELAPLYRETGQPVLVPGDMGRASYILVGSGNPLTWCSCCHGAGRAQSRMKALSRWKGKDMIGYMRDQGVLVMSGSLKAIAEEMPDAYKDVDLVVRAVEEANLARIVARLKPYLVVKG